MAAALSEADGIDYTDPEEVIFMVHLTNFNVFNIVQKVFLFFLNPIAPFQIFCSPVIPPVSSLILK